MTNYQHKMNKRVWAAKSLVNLLEISSALNTQNEISDYYDHGAGPFRPSTARHFRRPQLPVSSIEQHPPNNISIINHGLSSSRPKRTNPSIQQETHCLRTHNLFRTTIKAYPSLDWWIGRWPAHGIISSPPCSEVTFRLESCSSHNPIFVQWLGLGLVGTRRERPGSICQLLPQEQTRRRQNCAHGTFHWMSGSDGVPHRQRKC